ncbi:MAG: hypothetical protein JEZ04_00330 [Spirochaetales bacterium]|nr:hypothetical protein [Spirochaetales bacterium]
MSVSPLDMQTLFSNLKNVGQQQAAERSAEIASQDKQADALVRKADEKDHQVSETKDIETGVDKVNEKGKKQHEGSSREGKGKEKEEESEAASKEQFFEDPDIGHHIDISG